MTATPIACLSEEAWLAERKQYITASNVAAVMGLNPWATADDVLREMLTGERREANERMRLGSLLEPAVAGIYALETGTVPKPNGRTLWTHPDFPHLAATPDFLLDDDGVLECKAVRAFSAKSWKDESPIYYQVQVSAQLACTGRTYGVLAALIGGVEGFVHRRYERDDEFLALMRDAVIAFWQRYEEAKNGNG